MEFQFDNDHQTIMGIPFNDLKNYEATRDAMLFNVYEGWQPTVEDVKRLRNQPLGILPEHQARYDRIFGQHHDD